MLRQGALAACLWLMQAGAAQATISYQLSGISDFSLPTWSLGYPAITAHIDLCVYATAAGGYSINASSAGGYVLTNTVNAGAQIPYALAWDDGGAGNLGGSSAQLTNNVAAAPKQHPNILDPSCGTGANARLTLTITQATMTAALSGTYKGAITLLIGAP